MKKRLIFVLICILLLGSLYIPLSSSKMFDENIIPLSNSSEVDLLRPTIATESGLVYVAWDDSSDGDSDIYLSMLKNDIWQPKLRISRDIGGLPSSPNDKNESQWDPSIVLENGNIYAIWLGNRDGDADIYYRHYNGIVWFPEVKMNEDNYIESQSHPRIAIDNGKIHVAWINYENPWQQLGDIDLHYRYFDGLHWHPEVVVGNDTGDDPQGWPDIAADNGKVHFVWCDMRDGDTDIFYTQFDGISWKTEQEISTDTNNQNQTQIDPAIAVENDKVYVVWADRRDGDYDIYYRYYDGISWQSEMEISQDLLHELQQRPNIAIDRGQIFVTWEDFRDGDSDIYFRHFDGFLWSPVEEVSSDLVSEYQKDPQLAVSNNRIHLIWMQEFGPTVGIYYRVGMPISRILIFSYPIMLVPYILSVVLLRFYWRRQKSHLDSIIKRFQSQEIIQ